MVFMIGGLVANYSKVGSRIQIIFLASVRIMVPSLTKVFGRQTLTNYSSMRLVKVTWLDYEKIVR